MTVEGGMGEEAKVKLGPLEAKAGAAVKGEVEVSSDGVKVSAKAEADAHIGSVKPLGGVEVGIVTSDEKENWQSLSDVRPKWTLAKGALGVNVPDRALHYIFWTSTARRG